MRDEFRAVLLDEFQDTSVIQMELLSTLFGDHAVTAVGDPNQAIYGWRGASASSLETFLERFQTGKAEEDQTLTLSTAWRNDVSILDAANRVAAPLREVASYQQGKDALKAQSPVLVPRPGAGQGRVEIAYTQAYDQALAAMVDFVQRVRSQPVKDGKRLYAHERLRKARRFPNKLVHIEQLFAFAEVAQERGGARASANNIIESRNRTNPRDASAAQRAPPRPSDKGDSLVVLHAHRKSLALAGILRVMPTDGQAWMGCSNQLPTEASGTIEHLKNTGRGSSGVSSLCLPNVDGE